MLSLREVDGGAEVGTGWGGLVERWNRGVGLVVEGGCDVMTGEEQDEGRCGHWGGERGGVVREGDVVKEGKRRRDVVTDVFICESGQEGTRGR